MKNLIILTSLFFVFSVVSAQAQMIAPYTTQVIPTYVDSTMLPVDYTVSYAPTPYVACCGDFTQPYYQTRSVGSQPVAMSAPYANGYAGGNCCCSGTTLAALPAPACLPGIGQPQVVLGQNQSRQYIGRGIIGQPKLYVSGQPVRNALRFITP